MTIIERKNEITGNVAEFSTCLAYRYSLLRWIKHCDQPRTVVFCGLNPSTADENKPDPTVTRCTNFAKDWGFDAYWMLNLFAYRETSRALMKKHPSPVGPRNDEVILRIAERADLFVCAWGTDGVHLGREQQVLQLLRDVDIHCLRLTKHGHPEHPLYMPASTKPILFQARS
jgi:hypothetical protein